MNTLQHGEPKELDNPLKRMRRERRLALLIAAAFIAISAAAHVGTTFLQRANAPSAQAQSEPAP